MEVRIGLPFPCKWAFWSDHSEIKEKNVIHSTPKSLAAVAETKRMLSPAISMACKPSIISFSSSKPNKIFSPSNFASKSSFQGIRIQLPRPLQTRWNQNPSSSAVRMAKKQEELKDIRAKTTEEINEEIVDLKGELFMLRLQKSARNEFKSSEFRRMRKRVARMLTVRREREIEDGIGKRLSRKLDRKWKKSIIVRPPPSLRKKQEEQKTAEAEKTS